MRIFLFQITDSKGKVTISQVHCRNRIEAMFHLSLILGCEDLDIDFIMEESGYIDMEYSLQFN